MVKSQLLVGVDENALKVGNEENMRSDGANIEIVDAIQINHLIPYFLEKCGKRTSTSSQEPNPTTAIALLP